MIKKSLLLMAYTVLEGGSTFNGEWIGREQRYFFYFQRNIRLECLYESLKELGYQMSEEEEQIMNGTHELYDKPPEAEVDDCDDGCFEYEEDEEECESA